MVIIRAMEAIWPMSKPSLESRDPYSLLGDKLNFIVDIKSLINQLKAFSSISFMRFVLLKFAVCSANEVELSKPFQLGNLSTSEVIYRRYMFASMLPLFCSS